MDPLKLNDKVEGFTKFMREYLKPMSSEELMNSFKDAINRTGVFKGVSDFKISKVLHSFAGELSRRGYHVSVYDI